MSCSCARPSAGPSPGSGDLWAPFWLGSHFCSLLAAKALGDSPGIALSGARPLVRRDLGNGGGLGVAGGGSCGFFVSATSLVSAGRFGGLRFAATFGFGAGRLGRFGLASAERFLLGSLRDCWSVEDRLLPCVVGFGCLSGPAPAFRDGFLPCGGCDFGTRSFVSQIGQRTVLPTRCTGTLKTCLQDGHLIFSGIRWELQDLRLPVVRRENGPRLFKFGLPSENGQ